MLKCGGGDKTPAFFIHFLVHKLFTIYLEKRLDFGGAIMAAPAPFSRFVKCFLKIFFEFFVNKIFPFFPIIHFNTLNY